MDYLDSFANKRLLKVINGEQGGVSDISGWSKGGSFLYCELMQWNDAYISQIRKATTTDELLDIWKEMQSKAFISDVPPKKWTRDQALFASLAVSYCAGETYPSVA
jgi:adenine-specific DNA-methyltransferase